MLKNNGLPVTIWRPGAVLALSLILLVLLLAACTTATPAPTAAPTAQPSSVAPTSLPPAKNAPAYTAFWQAAALASSASSFGGAPLPPERGALFSGAGACAVCHTNMRDQAGKDVSVDKMWRATMLANAARDPYWRATVRSEVNQAPQLGGEIEKKCAQCHTPMAEVTLTAGGQPVALLDQGLFNPANALHPLANDGVSCTLCHQVEPGNLGKPESFSGGYLIDTLKPQGQRVTYGPYQIGRNQADLMQVSSGFIPVQGLHLEQSEMCGTCHDLVTPYVDSAGKVAGEFGEQLIYSEWANSAYAKTKTCQACHMPQGQGGVQLSITGGPLRQPFFQHVLVGGNAYMARLMQQNGEALQVVGAPEHYAATIQRTVEQFSSATARLTLQNPRLENGALLADLAVENLAGHKFPAGFPSRRAWLHIRVLDKDGAVAFESGAVSANGAITGNDNDADPARYEPHYTAITSPEQVQIYEGIMANSDGQVTTTLLRAARYIKDNRLLPAGFTPNAQFPALGAQGQAAQDAAFTAGSHRLSLKLALGQAQGPFTLEVNLLYQTVAYRWSENLAQQKGAEISAFDKAYDALPNLPLTAASARLVLP